MFIAMRKQISTARYFIKSKTGKFHRKFVVKLLVRTARELSADDATHMAAGVAYYGLFSLFPLLLALTPSRASHFGKLFYIFSQCLTSILCKSYSSRDAHTSATVENMYYTVDTL